MEGTIERTISLRIDPAQAWDLIGTKAGMERWFSDRIEGEWREGESVLLGWGEDRCRAIVECLVAPNRMAYRWIPGINDPDTDPRTVPSTLVEISLEPTPDGVLIRIVEAGFESLGDELRELAFRENSKGWDFEVADLARLCD